jgi:DNA-binding response OmpR family regulator
MSSDKRALIIEDNPTDQLLISSVLARSYVLSDSASSFTDAEKYLRDERYDLFVVDLRLPRHDGFYIIDKIRSMALHQKTPIIVTSGLRQQEDVRKAMQAGRHRLRGEALRYPGV